MSLEFIADLVVFGIIAVAVLLTPKVLDWFESRLEPQPERESE